MTKPLPPNPAYQRASQLENLARGETLDMVIIGGGATGVGIALDAASRGFRVALCEKYDFGKGTSSRSTKLVHGGVRYLQQGNVSLVREALHERGLLLKNAAHVVYALPTIVPLYAKWQIPYYWTGLKAYDLLAGSLNIGRSGYLSPAAARAAIPTLKAEGLQGGIRYFDAGFDDTRLLVSMLQTAIDEGATCINYLAVNGLIKQSGRVGGVMAHDELNGTTYELRARVVINATGPFSDSIRQMDSPETRPRIQPSQGIHIVLDRRFLPGTSAMIVPKTADGRVIFAIPWHGATLVGTTDTPLSDTPVEPVPLESEIDFLLTTVGQYLSEAPKRGDIRSIFAGIRPLVSEGDEHTTSKLARDHVIEVNREGLISVMGGKWTTYRRMAEDAVNRAIEVADLPQLACRTESMPLGHNNTSAIAELTRHNPELAEPLDPALPYSWAQVLWTIRNEMAMTVEDVLSRRTRALLLCATASRRCAPRVAAMLAEEHGHDPAWIASQLAEFEQLVKLHLPA
ncbi:FAD-dependent oxidoreductase [Aeoliella sp. SH292]|uniref:glycerol-3-phosphate dehydrogenase/oxidase n=1 Tax=Aeoliella sp. SH292 TaxID=3454464 RepID=UPI003F992873